MWSFVGNKGNKQWIWLALDVETREIVGVYVGDRSREGAQGLWEALPPVYRQCAVAYTDFWSAYDHIFPSKRHHSVGKESGQTSLIERFNCTLRQRVSRLVRKTLSFSKKERESHWGNLVLRPPLQRILTCLALPKLDIDAQALSALACLAAEFSFNAKVNSLAKSLHSL